MKLSIESQIVKSFSGIDWHGGSECYQVWSKTVVNCAQREVIWVSRGLTILFFSPIFFEICCTSVANLVKVSSWESYFVPIVLQIEANFHFESFPLIFVIELKTPLKWTAFMLRKFLIMLPKSLVVSFTSFSKSRLWVNSHGGKYVFVGSSEKWPIYRNEN